jgi:hypothetical protein
MESVKKHLNSMSVGEKLSLLWLFAMLNYIYADIMTIMDAPVMNDLLAGNLDVPMTPAFLFMGAILMEIPIAMVVLSRILSHKINRIANIVAGIIKTLAVIGSTFVGTPAAYYLFFGIIEIATTSFIVLYAWKWKES